MNTPIYKNNIFPCQEYRFVVFTMCYIALATKLILIDHPANKMEIDCFLRSFKVSHDYNEKITQLFELSSKDKSKKEFYLLQIKKLFGKNYKIIQSLINYLVKIALSDHYISNIETQWLIEVGGFFGLTSEKIIELIIYHLKSEDFDPINLLGLYQKNITKELLNKNYRYYANIYHPDKLNLIDASKEYLTEAMTRFDILTKLYQEAKLNI